MPFDATGFPGAPPPNGRRGGNVGAVLFAVIAALLLLMPFSLAACGDIARALGAR